jgi:uncharacterized protein (TIGR00297 family)
MSRPRKPALTRVADWLALIASGLLIMAFLLLRREELRRDHLHLGIALAITLAFALVGRLSHGVSRSGAFSGAVVAFLMASRDLRIFWILLVVFALTLAATRLGKSRKKQLRVAESDRGRSASQVIANLGIAGVIMAIPPFTAWRILALAALAEAAADTTSSEIGTAFPGRTVLISTWRTVSPGIDGGISTIGTIAGLLAAAVIGGLGAVLGLVPATQAIAIASAGTIGMLMDSLLGATLEKRGVLNNDLVNLAGTGSAVLMAWLIAGGF